jgi:hypothetical protein
VPTHCLKTSLACGALVLGLGGGSASALVAGPRSPEAFGFVASVVPVAMCGRTCRHGGSYIPGPPQVCYNQGLEYCGSSRGGGEYGYRGGGGYGGGCRTITIERDDGSVRRIRRCD